MDHIEVPHLPVSDKTSWAELPEVLDEVIQRCAQERMAIAPLVILEPVKFPPDLSRAPKFSEAPEQLVVVAWAPAVRATVFKILERVRQREERLAPARAGALPKSNGKTPLKSFFRQMRAMPATVLSLTFPDNGPSAISVFFIGPPFAVREFRRELAATPIDEGNDN